MPLMITRTIQSPLLIDSIQCSEAFLRAVCRLIICILKMKRRWPSLHTKILAKFFGTMLEEPMKFKAVNLNSIIFNGND